MNSHRWIFGIDRESGGVVIEVPGTASSHWESLKDKSVTVVGLGRSGFAAHNLLKAVGAHVCLADQRPRLDLSERLEQLDLTRVKVCCGEDFRRGFEDVDLVVISPGVPSALPILEDARQEGIPVIGEVELASLFLPSNLIAVTGTNGKSTVVSLIARMLEQAGQRVFVGGNIGTPLCEGALSAFRNMNEVGDGSLLFDAVVAEISSFQLETIQHFHPHVAVLLNVTLDHLDRHASVEEYRAIKARIFENQESDDFAVLNMDDSTVVKMGTLIHAEKVGFSIQNPLGEGVYLEGKTIVARMGGDRWEVGPVKDVGLRGSHNLANVCGAVAIGMLCRTPIEVIQRTIKEFRGIAHALEIVRERKGVLFVNDSKGTNVDATLKALESFDLPILVILGGKDKGSDFSRLRRPLQQRAKLVIVMGESASRLKDALEGIEALTEVESLQEAVNVAARKAEVGQVVLLSPACASFDMFRDYQDRGQQFRDAVNALS